MSEENYKKENNRGEHVGAHELPAGYKAVFDDAPTGMVIMRNSSVLYYNPKMAEIAGIDLACTEPFEWSDMIPESVYRWLENMHKDRVAGLPVDSQYSLSIVSKSGDVKYLDVKETTILYNDAPAVIMNILDITPRKKLEEAVSAIARGTASKIGEEFFRSLVIELSKVLGMKYAFVAELLPSGDKCRTIAFASDGKILANLEYELKDTPCDLVISKGLCLYPQDVQKSFPRDLMLIEMSVHGYMGIPLFASSGESLGLLCVLHDKPLTESELAKDILSIFAARAGAELERLRSDRYAYEYEQRSLQIFQQAPDPMGLFDITAAGRLECIALNPAAERIMGIREADILGKTVDDVFTPDLADIINKNLMKCIETVNAVQFEIIYHAAIGRRLLHVTNAPIKDESGKVRRIVFIARDITVQREMEDALRDEQAFIATILDNAANPILVANTRGEIIRWNRVCEIITGYTFEEVKGKPFWDVFLLPDERNEILGRFKDVVDMRVPDRHENHWILKDGSTRLYEWWNTTITDDAGKPKYVVGIAYDITDRKNAENELRKAEEKYRNIFEGAAIGIFQTTIQGRFLSVNPALAAMFGYSSPREMIDQVTDIPRQIYVDPNRRKEAIDYVRDHPGFHRFEIEYYRKDGSIMIAHLYYKAVKDDEGNIDYLEGFVDDITEQKKIEDEKKAFYKQTIKSVTQGRLELITNDEANEYLSKAQIRFEVEKPEDTVAVRRHITLLLRSREIPRDEMLLYLTGLGEAMNNAVKHAGRGEVYVGTEEEQCWVAVADNGSGIDALTLPGATLRRGFSTTISMGMGYSIMLEASDRLLLCTGKEGTTVILVKKANREKVALSLDDLPDTWNTI